MIVGHLAIAALLQRYGNAETLPVLAGSVAPDIVDKTLCQGLNLTRSGRFLAHTLLSLALSTTAVWRLWGRSAARSWGLGYLGHLVADLDGFVPWWYPWRSYQFPPRRMRSLWHLLRRAAQLPGLVEIGLVVWAALAHLYDDRPRGDWAG